MLPVPLPRAGGPPAAVPPAPALPRCRRARREAAALTSRPAAAARVTPWERALAQRGGREEGRKGGGGETWEFPTMHLCRLHEDGERGGGGKSALQSGGKGWDFLGGGTGCRGGAGRAVKAGQLHLHGPSDSGLSRRSLARQFGAAPAAPPTPPPASLAPPNPAWVCRNCSECSHKAGGNTPGRGSA